MLIDYSFVFFFKQKTAYEIQYGLVGSEMCIRDSLEDNLNTYEAWLGDDVSNPLTAKAEKFFDREVLDFLMETVQRRAAVSYTHLTLPTSDLVQISVVAVSLKKKIKKKKKKRVKKKNKKDMTK